MDAVVAAAHGNGPLLFALAVATVFAAVASTLPLQLRPRLVPAISLLAALVYFRLAAIGFLLDIAIAYAAVSWLGRRGDPGARWRLACLSILLVCIVFVAGRLEQAPAFLYALDMWLVLRLVTLLWEVGSGAVNVPSVGAYVSWACLPLTVAGPLLRYSEYTRVTETSCTTPWARGFAVGLLKMSAGISLAAADTLAARVSIAGPHAVGAFRALVTGPFGFYLTLAGYYQLMQALGRSIGIGLPDSFNWPIGRLNIGEFWANWNMTATRVFRDYLFYNRWGRGTYNIFLNTFLLFTLMGLWHGVNPYWLIFGMLHGVLFCGFLFWRRYRARLVPWPLHGTLAGRFAARVGTYVAVCACWYLPPHIAGRLGRL